MPSTQPGRVSHERRLLFDACFNVRDLGGYPGRDGLHTRWRTVYRGDGLHRLSDRDLDRLGDLGLMTVVDLRTTDEISSSGAFRTDRHPVTYFSLPLVDELTTPVDASTAPPPADRGERYADLAEQGAGAIAASLEILSRPGALPAAFHCSAGRDRTGILAAILLSLLGVDDATIVADYVLTQEAREVTERWVHANDPALVALWAKHPEDLRNTRPETMVSFLGTLRSRHGSVLAFSRRCGVTPTVLDALATSLLEP